MVWSLEWTYNEIVDLSDVKQIAASTIWYTSADGVFEIGDFSSMIKSLLPNKSKVRNTYDDNRLRSCSSTNKTTSFTEKSFFL